MYTSIPGRRSGQTLVEVVIAILILAITTVSVFSIFISNSAPQLKADKKEQAAMLIKNAQQTLQAFVSAAPDDPMYSPNAGGRWSADASGGWALAEGIHDISSLMNGTSLQVRSAQNLPVQCAYVAGCTDCCYLTYEVTDDNNCLPGVTLSGTSQACKTVVFNMRY